MRKVYIAWAIIPNGVANCGEYDSVELALEAMEMRGLVCAEIETEYRKELKMEQFTIVIPQVDVFHPETNNILLEKNTGYFYSAFNGKLLEKGIDTVPCIIKVITL